jgi:GNAT superfamily N-acetyltransferase
MTGVLTLRRVDERDSAFLAALAADRWASVPLPELAAMQDRAQRRSYAAEYGPDGEHLVLLDGEAVGRAWWADRGDLRRILDVAFLSSIQRRGLGSEVIQELIASAPSGCRVRCMVDRAKVRWHQHLLDLGFVEVDTDDLNVTLERPPMPAPNSGIGAS